MKLEGWAIPSVLNTGVIVTNNLETEYGYVYAIGYEGCIKIGISATDTKRRLNNMQSGNAEKIELIGQAYVPGYKETEKRLHKEWKEKGRWKRGEWYKLSIAEAQKIIGGLGGEVLPVPGGDGDPREMREREWMSMIGYHGGSFVKDLAPEPCFFNMSPRALHHSDHREKCFEMNRVSVPTRGLFDHEFHLVDSTGGLVGWITQPYSNSLENVENWTRCLAEAADKFGLMSVCPLNLDAPWHEGTRGYVVLRDPAASSRSRRADEKPPFLAWWYNQWVREPKDSISRDATAYGSHWDHLDLSPSGYNAWEMFEEICGIRHYGDRRLVSRAYREFVSAVGIKNISFVKFVKPEEDWV